MTLLMIRQVALLILFLCHVQCNPFLREPLPKSTSVEEIARNLDQNIQEIKQKVDEISHKMLRTSLVLQSMEHHDNISLSYDQLQHDFQNYRIQLYKVRTKMVHIRQTATNEYYSFHQEDIQSVANLMGSVLQNWEMCVDRFIRQVATVYLVVQCAMHHLIHWNSKEKMEFPKVDLIDWLLEKWNPPAISSASSGTPSATIVPVSNTSISTPLSNATSTIFSDDESRTVNNSLFDKEEAWREIHFYEQDLKRAHQIFLDHVFPLPRFSLYDGDIAMCEYYVRIDYEFHMYKDKLAVLNDELVDKIDKVQHILEQQPLQSFELYQLLNKMNSLLHWMATDSLSHYEEGVFQHVRDTSQVWMDANGFMGDWNPHVLHPIQIAMNETQ